MKRNATELEMVTAGLHRDLLGRKRPMWPNKYWAVRQAGTSNMQQQDDRCVWIINHGWLVHLIGLCAR